jgi:membrane-bound metal-dependent hydrolase YbcI (DUF457 family)
MKIPEHLALSYLVAQFGVQHEFGPAGTALVVLAGILPDLDGVSIVGGWSCHLKYHRVVGHGILVTLAGPFLLALLAAEVFSLGPLLPLWAWCQSALLSHLITDVCFYRWPVQLLWPFSTRGWGLGLVSWNDLVPTLVLYAGCLLTLWFSPPVVAGASLGALVLYLGCRALFPRPRTGWTGWLTGGWARESAPFWRWLTGDFIT